MSAAPETETVAAPPVILTRLVIIVPLQSLQQRE